MAGVPELNGVFGTFGGMSGLNIEPVLARQRGRMFAQQLAQEAARMAQQKELATRELDLRERGQDLGTQENELARQFAMNLQKFKQEFDAAEAKKMRDAAVEAQQRGFAEAQRAEQSSQGFQKQLEIDRFNRETPEREQRIRSLRAQEDLANKRADIEKLVEERRNAIDELALQIKQAEVDNLPTAEERAQLKKFESDVRALTMQKMELEVTDLRNRATPIMQRVDLAPAHLDTLIKALEDGQPIPRPILDKFMRVPGGLEFIRDIAGVHALSVTMQEAKEGRELGAAKSRLDKKVIEENLTDEAASLRKRRAKADTAFAEKQAGLPVGGAEAADGKAAVGGGPMSVLNEEEINDFLALTRIVESGKYKRGTGGGMLELRKRAFDELIKLSTETDPDAQDRVRLLKMLIDESKALGDKGWTMLQANIPETEEELADEDDPFDRVLGLARILGLE